MVFCFCHCVCCLFLVCVYTSIVHCGSKASVTFIQAEEEKRADDERRAADVFNTDYRSRQTSAQKNKSNKNRSCCSCCFCFILHKIAQYIEFSHLHTHIYIHRGTQPHSHSGQPLRCSSDRFEQQAPPDIWPQSDK